MASAKTCYCCGTALPEDNLAWNHPYPDLLAEQEDPGAAIDFESDAVIVSDTGTYLRAILPLHLTDGDTATLGVWIAFTAEADYNHVIAAAKAGGEAWASMTFSGRLANSVEPWPETYAARVTIAVPQGDEGDDLGTSLRTPQVVDSSDPALARVLEQEWPRQMVVEARGLHDPTESISAEPKRGLRAILRQMKRLTSRGA